MRKLLFILCGLIFLLSTHQASAHMLIIDGSIGAILHLEPTDDPIANQQNTLIFEFKDTANMFKPSHCDCQIAVIEQGKEIYQNVLFQNNTDPNSLDAIVPYTFPKQDIYKITVTGKPLTPNAFHPFTLTYEVRVDKDKTLEPTTQTISFQKFIIPIFAGSILVIFLILTILRRKNKKL